MSAGTVIWGICAGLIIALVSSYITKRTVGNVIGKMFAGGANSKENAKTAAELGINPKSRVLCGQLYGKIIMCANEYQVRQDSRGEVPTERKANPYKNPPLDMAKARFYIPEEKDFEAEERFCTSKTSLLSVIMGIFAIIIMFAIIASYSELISDFLGAIYTYIQSKV